MMRNLLLEVEFGVSQSHYILRKLQRFSHLLKAFTYLHNLLHALIGQIKFELSTSLPVVLFDDGANDRHLDLGRGIPILRPQGSRSRSNQTICR